MTSRRGVNYSENEDKALCEAWLTVSTDAAVSVYQTHDTFYVKVKSVFDSTLKEKNLYICDRQCTGLAARFQTISHNVSKFVGCYEQVKAIAKSGSVERDYEQGALELYNQTMKSRFKFFSCWFVLRASPKWGAWRNINSKKKNARAKPKKRSLIEASDTTEKTSELTPSDVAPSSLEDQHQRPIGISRAKAEKANALLYARQVKAAELMALNGKERIRVAQEQSELNMFLQAPASDVLAQEYLKLRRVQALARLKSQMMANRVSETCGNDEERGNDEGRGIENNGNDENESDRGNGNNANEDDSTNDNHETVQC